MESLQFFMRARLYDLVRDMTWARIEEGADRLRAEGGKASQMARDRLCREPGHSKAEHLRTHRERHPDCMS